MDSPREGLRQRALGSEGEEWSEREVVWDRGHGCRASTVLSFADNSEGFKFNFQFNPIHFKDQLQTA